MRALVLQHVACEPPAVFEDVMVERGWEILRVELDEGEPLPSSGFDAIVAMGGPMSVLDESEHPWLVAEKELIRASVGSGLPFWGSCLGVQLLAAALGARVYAGSAPEVGVLPVMLTTEGLADPVFGGLPGVFPTLQWHGDTFELPAGAVLLASSPAYANQAFRVGEAAYGVQFHVEVTRGLSLEWSAIPEYIEYADRVHGPGAIGRLLAEFEASCEQTQQVARAVFTRFCERAELTRA